jgi:uncharacterized membrane protein
MRRALPLATLAFLAAPAAAGGPVVTVEVIPNALSADDLSPDGRWVVGLAQSFIPYRYDRLTDTFIVLPGGISASAVSDDGSVVLGNMPEPGTGNQVAGIWREGQGWTSLGTFPGGGTCGSVSAGYELSGDGTIAVGLAWNECSGVGFRWTEGEGMVALESLANGNNRASVVSADGQVIGGFAQGSFSRTPARWAADGSGVLLDPPGGDAIGEVHGISDDGSVLLGEFDGDAVKWVKGGEPEILGSGQSLPGWIGIPTDIADDGTIVGFDVLLTNRRAWIQVGGTGDLRRLATWATDNGAVIPDEVSMDVAQAISADGRVVVGHGFLAAGWVMTIDPACVADVDGSGAVDFDDLLLILAGWGTDGPGADIAEPSDLVEFGDLLAVLAAWGDC